MPEIEALTNRVHNLSNAIDFWNAVMIWALAFAALAAVAVGVATRAIVTRTGKLSTAQDLLSQAKDRQLQADLKSKDVEIEGLKLRSDTAESHISTAQAEAAKAREKAAEANRLAEEERLARIKIEEKLNGWRLEPEAQKRLVSIISRFPKTPYDLAANPNEVRFMEAMDAILKSAGWDQRTPSPGGNGLNLLLDGKAAINYSSGITIEFALDRAKDFYPAAEALLKQLNAEGIPAHGNAFKQGGDPHAVHILIGKRE